jgi:hypothetical protein
MDTPTVVLLCALGVGLLAISSIIRSRSQRRSRQDGSDAPGRGDEPR